MQLDKIISEAKNNYQTNKYRSYKECYEAGVESMAELMLVKTPFKSDYVNDIKVAAAALIDLIDVGAGNPKWTDDELTEWLTLKDLAMIAAEQSAMWAVKAATY